jgi:hypothetical protein
MMSRDFLSYCKPATAEDELERGGPLYHWASDQYGRLRSGDTLWLVTAWPKGRLALLGRVIVGQVVNQAQAEQILGIDDLWEAKYHIIPEPGTEQPLVNQDIADLSPQLRFESDRDRLRVVDGQVNPGQLQTMRQLTTMSTQLLNWCWKTVMRVEASQVSRSSAAGFRASVENREVEAAAIEAATAELTARGWKVQSVERDRVGYDLQCQRGTRSLHVEVKGSRGGIESFLITRGEVARAETDEVFVLCLVANALSAGKQLSFISGTQFLCDFDLQPVSFQATRRKFSGEADV